MRGKVLKKDITKECTLEELGNLDDAKAKLVVEDIRANYCTADIVNHWGITQSQYYRQIVEPLGISKKNVGLRTKSDLIMVKPFRDNSIKEQTTLKQSVFSSEEPSMCLKFSGKYSGKVLQDKVLDYIKMLNLDTEYVFQMNIEEY